MDPVTGCADSASGTTQMGVGIAAAFNAGEAGRYFRFPLNPGHRSSCLQTLFTGWSLCARQARFHFVYDGFW